jgi:aspartate aminotransferase
MPLPAYVETISKASTPLNPDWFGYKLNEASACEAAAQSLRKRLAIPFEKDDIFMTKGASSALVIALNTILNPGDEVIFLSPPWFFYEAMIHFVRGVPVRVPVNLKTFDLDLHAIAGAITPKTRALIVNSPNNPTGKIYPEKTLRGLAELLLNASKESGRAIYLISDESYNRLVFDGRTFPSPTSFYLYSFLVYSYAKALLTPGQRLGYLALAPSMPEKERIRFALLQTQCSGYGFPDALLQHATRELEEICIDIAQLQRRRDRMAGALRGLGYEIHIPEGAWYLLPRSPVSDDMAFVESLAEENVFVMPGSIIELPGHFRIALTATDDMVERSLAAFAAAIKAAEAVTVGR